MADDLGVAVLTLQTDVKGFMERLDQAEKRVGGLREEFDKAGKSAKGAGDDVGGAGKKMGDSGQIVDELTKKFKTFVLTSLSIGAVTGAIKSYTDFTGKLTDLSLKTGIGVEALQRLNFAATQNGGTIEQVTGAITKLGANLVGGNKSAVGALEALGLSMDKIRTMQPDKAFTTIADAIARIEDPMARSKLAIDLFGKSGAELLPMMRGNLSETADEADRLGIVMSDSAVAAGDKFGDTIASLELVGRALIANALGPMVPALTAIASWMGDMIPKAFSAAKGWFDSVIQGVLDLKTSFLELIVGIGDLAGKIPWLGQKFIVNSTVMEGLRASLAASKEQAQAFANSTVQVGQASTTTSGTLKTLNLDYDNNEKVTKKAADTAARWIQSIKDTNFELNKMNSTILALPPGVGALQKTFVEFGEAADGTINNLGLDISAGLVGAVDLFGNAVTVNLLPTLGSLKDKTFEIDTATNTWQSDLNTLSQSFANLGAIGGDALGAVARGVGTLINGFKVSLDGISSFKGGLASLKSGDAMGGITGVMSGISGIVGAAQVAISAVKALWNWARGGEEGTVVNPARDKWFKDEGGLQGVSEGLMNKGLSWEDTQKLVNAVFDSKTKSAFDDATRKIDEILKGGLPGFDIGTRGRFVDFGSGTPIMAHGRERIVTEAEGMAEASRTGRMQETLESILRLLEKQPYHMGVSVKAALLAQ